MATILAASASVAHVESAISSASEGDTVVVPDGSATLTSTVTLNKRVKVMAQNNKGVTWTSHGLASANIEYDLPNDNPVPALWRGFIFDGAMGEYFNGFIGMGQRSYVWIDECDFDLTYTGDLKHAVTIGAPTGGLINGLISACNFASTIHGVNVFGDAGYWTDTSAHAPGTTAGLYIEDCDFANAGTAEIVDSQIGGVYVVRYCTIADGNLAMHGPDSAVTGAGYMESYHNVFTPGTQRAFAHILRGGTCYLHSNVVQGAGFSTFCDLQNWRTCFGVGHPGPFTSPNDNRCIDGVTNSLDEHLSPRNNGWP